MEGAKPRKRLFYILLALLILGGVGIFAVYALNKPVEGDPNLYLIPETYRGMVTIRYEIQGARPLPQEGNFVVHEIPTNGVLETSSSPAYGFAQDEFYFVDAQGKRTRINEEDLIHSRAIGGQEGEPPVSTFYVEAKEEWEKRKEK